MLIRDFVLAMEVLKYLMISVQYEFYLEQVLLPIVDRMDHDINSISYVL